METKKEKIINSETSEEPENGEPDFDVDPRMHNGKEK